MAVINNIAYRKLRYAIILQNSILGCIATSPAIPPAPVIPISPACRHRIPPPGRPYPARRRRRARLTTRLNPGATPNPPPKSKIRYPQVTPAPLRPQTSVPYPDTRVKQPGRRQSFLARYTGRPPPNTRRATGIPAAKDSLSCRPNRTTLSTDRRSLNRVTLSNGWVDAAGQRRPPATNRITRTPGESFGLAGPLGKRPNPLSEPNH